MNHSRLPFYSRKQSKKDTTSSLSSRRARFPHSLNYTKNKLFIATMLWEVRQQKYSLRIFIHFECASSLRSDFVECKRVNSVQTKKNRRKIEVFKEN